MAVINPTKGDLWDRLIILELKILNGWAEGKNVTHFREERAAIEQELRSTYQNAKVGALVRELTRVHAHLWDAAARQAEVGRSLPDPGPAPTAGRLAWTESPFVLGALAMELGALNRRRTVLKEEIERVLGEWKGADKI